MSFRDWDLGKINYCCCSVLLHGLLFYVDDTLAATFAARASMFSLVLLCVYIVGRNDIAKGANTFTPATSASM